MARPEGGMAAELAEALAAKREAARAEVARLTAWVGYVLSDEAREAYVEFLAAEWVALDQAQSDVIREGAWEQMEAAFHPVLTYDETFREFSWRRGVLLAEARRWVEAMVEGGGGDWEMVH